MQGNLSNAYTTLGRFEQALQMDRDIYCGYVKLNGEGHGDTLIAAYNYAASLMDLEQYAEAKTQLLKHIPLSRRILGEDSDLTLRMRKGFARALYMDADATLDDLREAATTLEELETIARRVLGGAHPTTGNIADELRNARAALRARETLLGGWG